MTGAEVKRRVMALPVEEVYDPETQTWAAEALDALATCVVLTAEEAKKLQATLVALGLKSEWAFDLLTHHDER